MNRTITQLVNLLRTFADELEGNIAMTPEAAAATQPAKPRGRPKKEEQPAAPAEPDQPIEAKKVEPEKAPEGLSLDQLKALIEPAVKAAAGKQVKELIAKHGGSQLADLPPENHAAFAKDVEGLVY